MKIKISLLAGLLMSVLLLEPTQAQSPVDDQLVKVMQAMKSTWTECTNKKFFDCITNVRKDGYLVTGTLNRQVKGGTEATDIRVGGSVTPADAQFGFNIDSKSYSTFPARSTPTPQFWRSETFDATPGQKDSGVLAAQLGSDPSSPNGGAGGVFICGNLTADFRMLLFPLLGGSGNKALVDLAQERLKALMQQFAQAISGSGACASSSAQKRLAIGQFIAGGAYPGGAGVISTRPYDQEVSVYVGEPTKDASVTAVRDVTIKLFYDDKLVSTKQTNAPGYGAGLASFGMDWLPKDTPKGRSTHQLKVQASKDGYTPVEAAKQIEVQNGLESTKILVKPVTGTYQANQTVTIEGKVFAAGTLWGTKPVQAKVTISQATYTSGGDSALGLTTTQADGSFSLPVQLPKSPYPVNVLTIQAVAVQPDQFEDVGDELSIGMEKGKQLLVNLGTDKGVYQQGDTVAVQGTVTSAGNPVSIDVQVFVDQVQQGAKTTGADGTFSTAFVPPALPGQLPAPGGQHLVVAVARATGYDDGVATAYFLVGGEALACVPLPFGVLNVKGQPTASSLIPPNAVPPLQPSGANPSGQKISVPTASPITTGSKLTQAMSVRTGANDQVVLTLPLDNGGEVRIGVDAQTEIKIGAFCRDASGKVKLLLHVDNPGKILINIDNPQGGASALDYKIVTPRNSVKSVGTRYAVAVDEQGGTTVASLDGTVLVSDLSDANTARVEAASQLTVPIGSLPNQMKSSARTLAIDTALEQIFNQTPAPARSPSASSPLSGLAAYSGILLGVAGAGFGVLILLVLGLVVKRSRSRRSAPARRPPSDLPERGRANRPTDLPK